jgi:hypothetical protein
LHKIRIPFETTSSSFWWFGIVTSNFGSPLPKQFLAWLFKGPPTTPCWTAHTHHCRPCPHPDFTALPVTECHHYCPPHVLRSVSLCLCVCSSFPTYFCLFICIFISDVCVGLSFPYSWLYAWVLKFLLCVFLSISFFLSLCLSLRPSLCLSSSLSFLCECAYLCL